MNGARKLTRRGTTRWIIDVRYVDNNGQRQRVRRVAALQTAAGAQAEARRVLDQIARTGAIVAEAAPSTPEPVRKKSLTFQQFVEGSFEKVTMPTFRPATRQRYRGILRQGQLEFFGFVPLDQIDEPIVRRYAATLHARKIALKGPINFLRTVLRAAKELGELASLFPFPRLFKTGKKLPASPSHAEVVAMAEAPGWLGLAVSLAAYAGLRMSECLVLEAGDVDLVAGPTGHLTVLRSLSEGEIVTPKSGDERTVPLAPQLVGVLRDAKRAKLPKARLVVTTKGRTPRRQEVLRVLKTWERSRGIKTWSFHSLRHYFCSTLVRSGVSLEVVRVLAGHSSLAVTERYVHAEAAEQRAAMQRFGLSGPVPVLASEGTIRAPEAAEPQKQLKKAEK